MKKFIFVDIGLGFSPFAPLLACGQILSAAIQGSASNVNSGITNLYNKKIAESTNKTNLAITDRTNLANMAMNEANNALQLELAQDANELNYKMFQEQNDWNLNMWSEQNEYNSPSNQMKRLIDAGINPNMLGQVGDTGNATSLPESANMPDAHVAATNPSVFEAGHVEPYDFIPLDVDFLSPLEQATRIDGMKSDNKAKEIRNAHLDRQYESEADEKEAQTKFVNEKLLDFIESGAYRKSKRSFELDYDELKNKCMEIFEENAKITRDRAKSEYEWWLKCEPLRDEKFRLEVEKLDKEVRNLDDEQILMQAQSYGCRINADANYASVRNAFYLAKLSTLQGMQGMSPSERMAFTETLQKNGVDFIKSLDNAALSGYKSKWVQEFEGIRKYFSESGVFSKIGHSFKDAFDFWLNRGQNTHAPLVNENAMIQEAPYER